MEMDADRTLYIFTYLVLFANINKEIPLKQIGGVLVQRKGKHSKHKPWHLRGHDSPTLS